MVVVMVEEALKKEVKASVLTNTTKKTRCYGDVKSPEQLHNKVWNVPVFEEIRETDLG